jgi:hypothetical protein
MVAVARKRFAVEMSGQRFACDLNIAVPMR